MKHDRTKVGAAFLCLAAFLSACNGNASVTPSSSPTALEAVSTSAAKTANGTGVPEKATYKENDRMTDWTKENPVEIRLNGTSASIDGSGAKVKDKSVVITAPGTYVLSGTWDDGQIVVNVAETETVRLVLNGVDIHSSGSAPIYVKEADKAILTLQEGSKNRISDGEKKASAEASDDEPTAAVFSKADLTVNGTGTLIVHGNANDGMTSKDDLKITGGSIEVYAADDGVIGRDLVAVKDGNLSVEAGGDGIKTTNDTESSKGNIAIEGGTFRIKAGSDGMQSAAAIRIDGGSYTIVSGGGSANGKVRTGNDQQGPRGSQNNAQQSTKTDSPSAKALKATTTVAVSAGTFSIDSSDDAVHSNGSIVLSGGEMKIVSGDDGLHADASIEIAGGTIDIAKSYEGIESSEITIADGIIRVVSSDDGVNVSGGNDGSSLGGRPGQNQFAASANSKLSIHGGTITVDANGDGLDANGSIVMTGGTVLVSGPTANNNGALDYDGTFNMSGGSLVAAGSAGMAMTPSEESGQSSILMTYSQTQAAGTAVRLKDGDGNVVADVTPAKAFQTIVISSPDLKKGKTYVLYSGETKIVEFTISNSVTWLNESGVTTARSAGPGGRGSNSGMGGGRSRP
ncbi:carbohydrate-binding domain-containing protein [Paenibacillus sp. MBLB4367]|uniref:carbohydrate-binding domain-containing protein n=1 Tax=Paenibacillus sp. MBLB4367 TaxID=3384767 RepID=UPI0039080A57